MSDPLDEEDKTVVVSRQSAEPGAVDESTVVVNRTAPLVPAEDESTVLVNRTAPLVPVDDEATVVVASRVTDDESTVVVVRPTDDESTVVVVRPDASQDETTLSESARAAQADKTIVVDRSKGALPTPPPRRRRGELRPAPVPVEVLQKAVEAVGPGAIATYQARDILPPPASWAVETGPAAVRQDPATIPSVAKRSARAGVIVVVSVVLAIVIAAVGLTAIAVTVINSIR